MFLFSHNRFLASLARYDGSYLSPCHLPEVPLHLPEVCDEGGCVKPLTRPEELPAVLGDGPVHHAGLGAYELPRLLGCTFALACPVYYSVYRLAPDPGWPSTSEKIPEAVQAFGIAAFQPTLHPLMGPHQIGGRFACALLAHVDHMDGKHYGSHS